MKKKVLSILLTAAMVMSMAVGCGSNKSASTDAKDDTKTESSADGESNQILFNGSSTLAPVITSIATNFFDTYGTWKAYDSSLPDEEVVVITRDINGGAHEVFQKNIMGDTEVKSDAIQASSMGELVQDIIDNPYAIGYASFGVANQNAGKVVTMKVNGVEPTKENIINGSYIIQRPLLLVGSGEPTAIQQAFLDVVLGDEGQKTVEDMGFIPMN